MSLFEIRLDTAELRAMRAVLDEIGQKAPQALVAGLNQTNDRARTQVIRAIVRQTGLKYGYVRQQVKTQRASLWDYTAALKSQGSALPLSMFDMNISGTQVRGRVYQQLSTNAGGNWHDLPGVFAPKGRIGQSYPAGSGLVAFKRAGRSRLPINKQFGPSLPITMVSDETRAAWESRMKLLPENVLKAYERYMRDAEKGEFWTMRVGRHKNSRKRDGV